MVLSRFMPKNSRFGELFTRQADNAVRAAEALLLLLTDYTDLEAKVQRLRDLEHEGDRLSRETVSILAESFIVPFDREDILQLNTHLDDFVDDIEEAGRKLLLYRVQRPIPQAARLAQVVVAQAECLARVMPLLEEAGRAAELNALTARVRSLEDEADALGDEVQLGLYDGVTEVRGMVDAMRMGEIVGLIEQATDQAQRVAATAENILLKNA